MNVSWLPRRCSTGERPSLGHEWILDPLGGTLGGVPRQAPDCLRTQSFLRNLDQSLTHPLLEASTVSHRLAGSLDLSRNATRRGRSRGLRSGRTNAVPRSDPAEAGPLLPLSFGTSGTEEYRRGVSAPNVQPGQRSHLSTLTTWSFSSGTAAGNAYCLAEA